MSENCANIIDLLIEQRHNQGMTQKELAQAACLTQSVIARLESKKAISQLGTLLKVASALGCNVAIVPAEFSGK
ncbi:helix-turn-helix domain-containing protein [Lachnoclostridium sp. Marseille-P6806]|uniref:helix-turn-helix domain-containing protein n=1 Tax=Lachnoclostridium sp. Marseille-P6806 TaxID=2364793 RepID=UPI0010312A4C|nr:helix-turn-helix transcriptional regulator [Lachnoclostridium sp. Marseille-P6806]